MLKYILSGEKPTSPNQGIDDVDKIVSRVKALPEVTKKYMKQWDREQTLQREAYNIGEENGRKEGKKEATDTVNQLNNILISEGRFDDLSRSVKDPEFQKKLIIELVDNDFAL